MYCNMLRSVCKVRLEPLVGRAYDTKFICEVSAAICCGLSCRTLHLNQAAPAEPSLHHLHYREYHWVHREQLSRYCAQVWMQKSVLSTEDCAQQGVPLAELQRHAPTALIFRVGLTPDCSVLEGLDQAQPFSGYILWLYIWGASGLCQR